MADSVEELFGYNRGNFMFDQKLRQWREYQEQNMRVKQFMLYREDMRDLNELTISKMDSYLMIAVLELGCCLDLLVHGVLHLHEMSKDEQPTWNLWLYVISLAEAFVFLFLSAWLAIHASVSAHSFTVRLLTQFVRLPVPSTEQLNAASATGTDYENMGIEDILRIPVIRQQAERLNAEQNAENEAEADPSGVAVSGLVMLQPGANEATAQKHVRVFRGLAEQLAGSRRLCSRLFSFGYIQADPCPCLLHSWPPGFGRSCSMGLPRLRRGLAGTCLASHQAGLVLFQYNPSHRGYGANGGSSLGLDSRNPVLFGPPARGCSVCPGSNHLCNACLVDCMCGQCRTS